MKTRNGFVSNSSSSSFVVAFPKKPRCTDDVLIIMFNGKEGGLSVYDNDGLSFSQVSKILFNDLKRINFKKATLKDITEEFFGRYHYYPNGNNFLWGEKTDDDHGGAWTEKLGRYYGSNREVLEQLRLAVVKSEENDKKLREEENSILSESGLKQPKYVYKGGIDPHTKKPYTDKEIKAEKDYYKDYYKAMNEFRKTNKKFLAFDTRRHEEWRKKYDELDKLTRKLAKEDAQNFLDDNKGKFIFIISYSDNDGVTGSTMEHGNIFRNVPHVRISHH